MLAPLPRFLTIGFLAPVFREQMSLAFDRHRPAPLREPVLGRVVREPEVRRWRIRRGKPLA
jgi:uncharacterized protein (DUF2236 family)